MSGAFNSPVHKRRPSINITPLIDVMFLLLIFFMVSSTFKEHPAIDITLPHAGTAIGRDVSFHEIVVDDQGQLYFAGETVTLAQLRERLQAVIELDEGAELVLRADRAAKFGRVVAAMDIAREVGGERLIIPTDPLPEE